MLFYATPIIYPLSLVQELRHAGLGARRSYELNPLVGIFQLHHAVWYPDEFAGRRAADRLVVGSLLVLLAGWWSFRRLEPAVLKEL